MSAQALPPALVADMLQFSEESLKYVSTRCGDGDKLKGFSLRTETGVVESEARRAWRGEKR